MEHLLSRLLVSRNLSRRLASPLELMASAVLGIGDRAALPRNSLRTGSGERDNGTCAVLQKAKGMSGIPSPAPLRSSSSLSPVEPSPQWIKLASLPPSPHHHSPTAFSAKEQGLLPLIFFFALHCLDLHFSLACWVQIVTTATL